MPSLCLSRTGIVSVSDLFRRATESQQVAVGIEDVELLHVPGPYFEAGKLGHAAFAVLFVQGNDLAAANVAGGMLGMNPILGQPEMKLHLVAPHDQIVVFAVDDSGETEQVDVEIAALVDIERGENGNASGMVGAEVGQGRALSFANES